ncbi:MAG: YgiT-type zinc finger protein [Chitinivibrionales bacterium]|nr:YgiT-type zinc finger protein [Chitinivibrionales bacterium]
MDIKKCPICGSIKIKQVSGEFKAHTGKRIIVIPSVKRQQCASCGEEFFDREANAILDRYRKTCSKPIKIAA